MLNHKTRFLEQQLKAPCLKMAYSTLAKSLVGLLGCALVGGSLVHASPVVLEETRAQELAVSQAQSSIPSSLPTQAQTPAATPKSELVLGSNGKTALLAQAQTQNLSQEQLQASLNHLNSQPASASALDKDVLRVESLEMAAVQELKTAMEQGVTSKNIADRRVKQHQRSLFNRRKPPIKENTSIATSLVVFAYQSTRDPFEHQSPEFFTSEMLSGAANSANSLNSGLADFNYFHSEQESQQFKFYKILSRHHQNATLGQILSTDPQWLSSEGCLLNDELNAVRSLIYFAQPSGNVVRSSFSFNEQPFAFFNRAVRDRGAPKFIYTESLEQALQLNSSNAAVSLQVMSLYEDILREQIYLDLTSSQRKRDIELINTAYDYAEASNSLPLQAPLGMLKLRTPFIAYSLQAQGNGKSDAQPQQGKLSPALEHYFYLQNINTDGAAIPISKDALFENINNKNCRKLHRTRLDNDASPLSNSFENEEIMEVVSCREHNNHLT